jgi:hypothetical protein
VATRGVFEGVPLPQGQGDADALPLAHPEGERAAEPEEDAEGEGATLPLRVPVPLKEGDPVLELERHRLALPLQNLPHLASAPGRAIRGGNKAVA